MERTAEEILAEATSEAEAWSCEDHPRATEFTVRYEIAVLIIEAMIALHQAPEAPDEC